MTVPVGWVQGVIKQQVVVHSPQQPQLIPVAQLTVIPHQLLLCLLLAAVQALVSVKPRVRPKLVNQLRHVGGIVPEVSVEIILDQTRVTDIDGRPHMIVERH